MRFRSTDLFLPVDCPFFARAREPIPIRLTSENHPRTAVSPAPGNSASGTFACSPFDPPFSPQPRGRTKDSNVDLSENSTDFKVRHKREEDPSMGVSSRIIDAATKQYNCAGSLIEFEAARWLDKTQSGGCL